MRFFILSLLLMFSCVFAQEKFKISDTEVRQIIDRSKALCVFKGELVLIEGLDFSTTADGKIVRSKAHGSYSGNYTYETILGGTKTVRRIKIMDNGERR